MSASEVCLVRRQVSPFLHQLGRGHQSLIKLFPGVHGSSDAEPYRASVGRGGPLAVMDQLKQPLLSKPEGDGAHTITVPPSDSSCAVQSNVTPDQASIAYDENTATTCGKDSSCECGAPKLNTLAFDGIRG